MEIFNFGENLRTIRRTKDISQEAMAMYLDISQASYSRLENQQVMGNADQVVQIARILNIEPSRLTPSAQHGAAKEIEPNAESSIPIVKSHFNSAMDIVLWLAIACALVPSVYDLVKAFCIEFKGPDYVTLSAPSISALAVLTYLWYLSRRIKKAN